MQEMCHARSCRKCNVIYHQSLNFTELIDYKYIKICESHFEKQEIFQVLIIQRY